MDTATIEKIAREELENFYTSCEEEILARGGSLEELQGFDFPDSVEAGDDFREYCEDHNIPVPQGAIGGTCIRSCSPSETSIEFIFPETSEKEVRKMCRGLYPEP